MTKIQSVIILQYEVILKEQYQYKKERRILINLRLINNRNTMPVFIQENHLNRIITVGSQFRAQAQQVWGFGPKSAETINL